MAKTVYPELPAANFNEWQRAINKKAVAVEHLIESIQFHARFLDANGFSGTADKLISAIRLYREEAK